MHSTIRLNKFIAESGYCSRREADRFIENGQVYLNGKKATIGDQVKPGDKVKVNGYDLEPRKGEDLVIIALNKPVGITSTTEKGVRDNIVDFVNHSSRIFPVGRLDKDSQGLILLTNDGDIVNKILRAGNNHEKEYVVTVNKVLTPEVISGMANGVSIMGVNTRKCKVVQEGPHTFRIVLVQGLNRQIRRMCEHYGYEVVKLERVRIMHIGLKGLPLGEWRELTREEEEKLYLMVEDSSAEAIKTKPSKPKDHKPKSNKPHQKKSFKDNSTKGKPYGNKGSKSEGHHQSGRKSKPGGNRRGR